MTNNKKVTSLEELPAQFYLQILTQLHNCIIELRKAFINVPGEHGKFFNILADTIIDGRYKEYIMLTQALQFNTSNDGIDTTREANKEEAAFVDSLMDNLRTFHETLNDLDDEGQSTLLESFGFGDHPDKRKNEVTHEA